MTASTETKKVKKQGPLRLEAIIPLSVIVLLTGLYSHFYLNAHVRKLMEWTLSSIHGAEVNVNRVGISLFKGQFEINGLQVTDKKNPEVNAISIGSMRFHFSWDAALRAKIVIDESTIEDVGFATKRKKKGVIFPPAKRSDTLVKLEQVALAETQQRFDNNVLGDLAEIIGGQDPKDQLNELRGELKTENKIKELEDELKQKENEWKTRVDTITNKEDLKKIEQGVKNYKFDKKDPVKSIKTATNLYESVQTKVKQVEDGSKNLKSDVNYFDQNLKAIPDMVKQDIKDVEGRFKIPSLDLKDMSIALFAGYIGISEADVIKYITLAKEYMPPPKAERQKRQAEEKIVPRQRGQGETYKFPITVSYPTFWLKKAEISSSSQVNPLAGDFKGTLTNVTTHPSFVKIPAILELNGDLPQKKLEQMLVKLTIDHTTVNPAQEIIFSIGRFPVGELKFSDSSSLKFFLQKPEGKASLRAKSSDQGVNVDMTASLSNYTPFIEAKNKHVGDILTGVMNDIKNINISSKTTGQFGSLKTTMSSNLGSEIAKGVKREVEAKINEAKNSVRAMVESRIKEQREKLEAQYAKVKEFINKNLDKYKGEVDSFKKSSLGSLDKEKNKQSDEVKEKANDLLKDLKKKIKL